MPESVSGETTSRTNTHWQETGVVLNTPGGRPANRRFDDTILSLAGEGLGVKAIAKAVNREANGSMISFSTVGRRLRQLRP